MIGLHWSWRFVISLADCSVAHSLQPFVTQVTPSVEALQHMGSKVNEELRDLLQFFGEKPEGSESMKPEEFFGLVMSFSSALQVRLPLDFKLSS